MFRSDTITAISTPPGRGGIGVVRLSGPRALELASAIFHSESHTSLNAPGRVQFGRVIDPAANEAIDQALMTYFKAPRSYTGEDVVELSCHGSPVILRRVLDPNSPRRQSEARNDRPQFEFRADSSRIS